MSIKSLSAFSNPIVRSTVGLLVVSVILKVLGYGEKIALAWYFGTSYEADVFVVVSTLILAFFFFAREVVEPIVLNGFMRSNKNEGWNLFNYVLRGMCLIALPLVILSVAFPGSIVDVVAPGFDVQRRSLATTLFRIASPAILFLSISTVTNIVLNANKVFVYPSIGDLASKVVSMACILLLAKTFGVVSCAIGIFLGAVIKLIIHLAGLYRKVSLNKVSIEPEQKQSMWTLGWPLMLGMFFSQLTGVVDNLFASYMEDGSLAALSYARKVVELPVLIFPYIFSVVIFPYFTQLSIEKNDAKSIEMLSKSLQWITIAFVPLSIYFSLFSTQLIELIFRRGAFDSNSVILTAGAFLAYSPGLLFFAIETILVVFYYANADTKTPIFVGIACVIANILLTWLLLPWLEYLAIAIALVFQKVLKIVILSGLLRRKMPVDYSKVTGFAARLAVPLILFTVVQLLFRVLIVGDERSVVYNFLMLTCSLLVGGTLYLVSLTLVKAVKPFPLAKWYTR